MARRREAPSLILPVPLFGLFDLFDHLFMEEQPKDVCAMKKRYSYPFSAALLLLGASAIAQVTPAAPDVTAPSAALGTPAGTAHVDYYRSNIGHTGVADEKLNAPFSVLWRHTTAYAKNNPASPVYGASTVYFPSGGALYALNALDGTMRWQYPSDGKARTYFATTPALSAGFLYVTDDNGQAYKFDAATGKQIWTAKLEGAIRSAPIISNGVVYFGSGNSHCYALSADTGQVIWDAATGGAIITSPTITGGLVVFTSSDSNVYSLNARTGKKGWAVPFAADPSLVPPIYDGSLLYVTAGDTVYGLDPNNGSRRSTIKLPTSVLVPPTVSSDSVYVITQSNALYALTLAGRERWRVTLDAAETAPPLLAGNLLLVATQPGVLSGYDAGSGKLVWRYVVQASATDSQPKYSSTSVYAAPIVAAGTLYVVSDDGSLTAFRSDAPGNIGPQLTQLAPEAGATVRGDGLTYGALVVDEGSGIDPASVKLQVDGETDAKALYHAGQNAVYNTPTEPLKEGEHKITLKAADWRGNVTSQTWSFTVGDPGSVGFPGANPNFPGGGGFPGPPNFPGGGGNPNGPGGGRRDPGVPPPPPIAPF